MKKSILVYLLALVLGGVMSLCTNVEARLSDKVIVDLRLEEPFDRFTTIMEKAGIEIDYDKIDAIVIIPLDTRYNGIYWENSVYLSTNLQVPKGTSRAAEEDFVLYVLAHEIAHSQGMMHTPNDPWNLMYNSAEFALNLLYVKSIEEIILDAYCPD